MERCCSGRVLGLGAPQMAISSHSMYTGLTPQESTDKSQQNSIKPVHRAQLLEKEHRQGSKESKQLCV